MKQPRICVSVAAGDEEEIAEALRRATEHNPDLIEVRLDYMKGGADLERLRTITAFPLIATNRPTGVGGNFTGSEEKRIGELVKACEAGFEYIDLELLASEYIDLFMERGARVILSHHNFSRTPPLARLEATLDEMLESKPDICKIVGTSQKGGDNLTYLELIRRAYGRAKIVSFGMGEAGLLSRVLSPLIGGEYTYASAGAGEETAPGQISIEMLRALYRLLEV